MYQIGVALSGVSGGDANSFSPSVCFDAAIDPGIDAFWEELRPGIAALGAQFDWLWIGRVAVHEDCVGEGVMSPLERRSIVALADRLMVSEAVKDCDIFLLFVSDWPADGEVRYGEGSPRDLDGYLRLFN